MKLFWRSKKWTTTETLVYTHQCCKRTMYTSIFTTWKMTLKLLLITCISVLEEPFFQRSHLTEMSIPQSWHFHLRWADIPCGSWSHVSAVLQKTGRKTWNENRSSLAGVSCFEMFSSARATAHLLKKLSPKFSLPWSSSEDPSLFSHWRLSALSLIDLTYIKWKWSFSPVPLNIWTCAEVSEPKTLRVLLR